MKPGGGGAMPEKLKKRIEEILVVEKSLLQQFIQAEHYSVWIRMVLMLSINNGKLVISKTPNAENTLIQNMLVF